MCHGTGSREQNREGGGTTDKLHRVNMLPTPGALHVIVKCVLEVIRLAFSIQPGRGRHSRGSAHRRHSYAGPGSAADGQEAGHCEEAADRGDFR